MKHFRLNIAICLLVTVAASFCSALLIYSGRWAAGILVAICIFIAVCILVRLIRRLVLTMSTFMDALEMNDSTMRFDIDCDDPDIQKMHRSMNSICSIYHNSIFELETRKLYYDRILRIMTHEMRNTITPIVALTSDFRRHPDKYTGENLVESMALIEMQSEGIKKFLDSYYKLTHLPVPHKEAVPVGDFLRRIQSLVRLEESDRGLGSICRFISPADMTIYIDADLMTQAVINLIRNSLDAVSSSVDGKIMVTVSVTAGQPYISISDNGPGIPAKVMKNLFQPFITSKEGGSGIGLSLSRQIARLHGGDLKINSSPHGTIAYLSLPDCAGSDKA